MVTLGVVAMTDDLSANAGLPAPIYLGPPLTPAMHFGKTVQPLPVQCE